MAGLTNELAAEDPALFIDIDAATLAAWLYRDKWFGRWPDSVPTDTGIVDLFLEVDRRDDGTIQVVVTGWADTESWLQHHGGLLDKLPSTPSLTSDLLSLGLLGPDGKRLDELPGWVQPILLVFELRPLGDRWTEIDISFGSGGQRGLAALILWRLASRWPSIAASPGWKTYFPDAKPAPPPSGPRPRNDGPRPLTSTQRDLATLARALRADGHRWKDIESECRDPKTKAITPRTTLSDWIKKLELQEKRHTG